MQDEMARKLKEYIEQSEKIIEKKDNESKKE